MPELDEIYFDVAADGNVILDLATSLVNEGRAEDPHFRSARLSVDELQVTVVPVLEFPSGTKLLRLKAYSLRPNESRLRIEGLQYWRDETRPLLQSFVSWLRTVLANQGLLRNSPPPEPEGDPKGKAVSPSDAETPFDYDCFVSHASEDKDEVVRPLVEKLVAKGLRVWYDEYTLRLGDSLRESIDRGLLRSKYGVLVLSPNFFEKHWPAQELNGLAARERKGTKVILPVWFGVDHEAVLQFSPILADRVAARWTAGIDAVVEQVVDAISTQPSVPTRPDSLRTSVLEIVVGDGAPFSDDPAWRRLGISNASNEQRTNVRLVLSDIAPVPRLEQRVLPVGLGHRGGSTDAVVVNPWQMDYFDLAKLLRRGGTELALWALTTEAGDITCEFEVGVDYICRLEASSATTPPAMASVRLAKDQSGNLSVSPLEGARSTPSQPS